MNCNYARISAFLNIILVAGLSVSQLDADTGTLGRVAVNLTSSAWDKLKKVIPSKPVTVAAVCLAGGIAVKALWTRHVTLGKIDKKINPDVVLYVDQTRHPIYNWMMGAPGLSTPAQIRANLKSVKSALITACLSGEIDIFQNRTGNRLTASDPMYWADVMSSIDAEIAYIRGLMRSLEPLISLSFGGIHLFGVRRNFVHACDNLDIGGFDQLRHGLTVNQEEQIASMMTEDRGLGEKAIALLMANPNYDKAHRIFWELDQRLGRLQAIKEAIVATPVSWHVALH